MTEPPTTEVAVPATAPASVPAPRRKPARAKRTRKRRIVESLVLLLTAFLVLRVAILEPFSVPTGSMAPQLAGRHKADICPRCGFPLRIGYREELAGYPLGSCANCGKKGLDFCNIAECPGDNLLVDKTAFAWRRPHRWELAVFRFPDDPGKVFVKRIVGLPGEAVQIRDGDVAIDRFLARKTLDEFKSQRITVFNNNYQPRDDGWRTRWLTEPPGGNPLEGIDLRLDAVNSPDDFQWLTYRNYRIDERRERPITDGYGYNGPGSRELTPVHDFMLECDVEVIRGSGLVAFSITDGDARIVAELAVDHPAGFWLKDANGPLRYAPGRSLVAHQRHHIELALVDRRATLAIDGRQPFAAVDLPEIDQRRGVTRPAQIGGRGVELIVSNFRLFRDVHYTPTGEHGTRQPYRIGASEYFVLGDNSPESKDSRLWNQPFVPDANFIGKPIAVHLPLRNVRWRLFGQPVEFRGPDWGRIRWLR
jgi:signal peptidase I